MMRPHFLLSIEGNASRVVWNAELRLMAMIASHFADRKLLKRRHVLDAGIIDQHVHAAEHVDCHLHHLGDLLGPGHVGGGIGHRHAEIRPDARLRCLDLLLIAETVEDYGRARLRERTGNAEPDAAG